MTAAEPVSRNATWTSSSVDDVVALGDRAGLRVRAGERLSRHTSMGIGGPCAVMVWPRRGEDVAALVEWMSTRGLGWRPIGGGSNLLVADHGVDAAVLNLTALVDGAAVRTGRAHLPAGTPTAQALRETAERGLDGLVWAAGLPGTIGGAAAGNAGCWGGDMAQTVLALDIVEASGAVRTIERQELVWEYRRLRLGSDDDAPTVIVGVDVELTEGDPVALRARYEELQRQKRQRQPIGARNCGCIFRNPDGGRTAGQLIDQAGCKGLRQGAIEVSAHHANFFMNRGGGAASDVIALIDAVRARVADHFDTELKPEIRRW